VSWQAAVLALLAAILLAGIAWYERSRPRTQVIALVAAMAALAVVGRIAFSPIPNVVPTTDIALISGYALGGAPGIAVGGLAALVSNFWLGQGPWTPWQMAGWGMAGALGAALAAVTGRRVGRLGLAAACGAAGLAYGALLDLSLMVSYGGEQSLERFLALSSRGIPFNLAHAAGNFAIALVAGPALVRMLLRYRRRFEFAWPGATRAGRPKRKLAAGAACALAGLSLAAGALTGPDGGEAAAAPGARAAGPGDAVTWVRGAQNPDGGFGAEPRGDSSPEMTGWAMLGLEAAGVHPSRVRRGGTDPIAYLKRTKGRIRTTGDLQRTILALSAARVNPRAFAGRDLVALLLKRRRSDGSWEGQVNSTAFGILALKAAGRRAGAGSKRWLREAANPDGGWGFAPGAESDADSTGAALQALAAAGGSRAAIRAGTDWLRRAQRGNGGFALLGGPVNAQSTAWATQGLLAAGVSPQRVRTGGRSPLDYLASVQARDGHYRYSRSFDQTPVWVTAQALAAVSGQAFPLRPLRRPRPQSSRSPRPSAPPAAGAAPPAAPPGGAAPKPKKPKPKQPAKTSAPPAAREPQLERIAPAGESASEPSDSPLPELGGASLALLSALGGAWMLRRQRL